MSICRLPRRAVSLVGSALLILGLNQIALAEAPVAAPVSGDEDSAPPSYSRRGADTCLKCHDEDSEFPVLTIFETPHGQRADPRSPFNGLQCEACHGPAADHAGRVAAGETRPPPPYFGPHSTAGTTEQNQACLNCHQAGSRKHWTGSEHEAADLSCASCHRVHQPHDPILSPLQQNAVCSQCHTRELAQSLQASAHPLHNGELRCGDCHAAHGTVQDHLLSGMSPNDGCFGCHAEKRGPFLWEHAPVSEDCGLCHQAHGANHPALLKQRPPWLCQQCHSQAGHPSLAMSPESGPSAMLSLRSCNNCHVQVHGSNHPSGAALLR